MADLTHAPEPVRSPAATDAWTRLSKNSGWLLAEKAVRWAAALIVGVWLARYLGPVHYGQLGYALALAGLWGGLATLGVDNLVVRELVRQPDERRAILATALGLRIVGGCLAAVGAIITAWLLRGSEDLAVILTAVASLGVLWAVGETFDGWFQAELRADLAVRARTFALLIVTATRIALLLAHAPVLAFAAVAALETLLAAFALAWAARRAGVPVPRPRLAGEWTGRLLRECWPNIIANLAVMAYMRLDRVLLGELAGESSVGLYAAAASLVEVWYVVPMALVTSATPLFTRLRTEDPARYLTDLARLARLLAGIGFVVAAALTATAPWLLPFLFGEAFRPAVTALMILPWGLVLIGLGVAVSPWYLNERLLALAMQRHLFGMVVGTALHFALIPRWGTAGAAVATVAAFATAHVLGNVLDARTRPILRLQLRALFLLPPRSPASP